jgi:arginine/lysine/ornithine decarboxylase
MNQRKAPIYEALMHLKSMRIVPFDVPGHKRGRGNEELSEFLGKKCLEVDVNSMKPLDNLCHPTSVIKEAEELAAEAFGASHAFFMVGGTTSAVQSMILSAVKSGDEIILPRNVHRSVINALVLCGAVPVYVNPETNERLGISLGMKVSEVERAISEHPNAKAVVVNNPTYYGICSDIKSIVKLAHDNNMLVLADEAHGTHFYFGKDMPIAAIHAGADIAAVSMHKSGGSLTQSSFLLTGENVNSDYVRQIINLTQTTSGSYLLMSSLDLSRRNLALHGEEIYDKIKSMVSYARDEINAIGDYYAYGHELINGDSIYNFDETKLAVHTLDTGLAGIEVYDILRDDYDIQTEFGDMGNMLAYISVGDREKDIERLISALSEIRRRFKREKTGMLDTEYINPKVITTPQKAFYANKEQLELTKSLNRVCAEFVMCYPPGIPILAPGELITPEIIEYIAYAKEKGCTLLGTEDLETNLINVIV